MHPTYKKIGLLDHMGWGNMGDAAVQEAFIANIKKRQPNAELIAFSLNPDDTRKRHHLPAYSITWSVPIGAGSDLSSSERSQQTTGLKSLLKRWRLFYKVAKPIHDVVRELVHLVRSYRVVRTLDLLIISGGGQLCELWRGPWSHPYNVFKFCLLAKLSRTPVFIVGVGAGPLEHPLSKFFARWSVRMAAYTSFRDAESRALLCTLGVNATTYVYPDPAYALGVPVQTTATFSKRPRPKVGLNPIGYCDPRIWPRQDEAAYSRYLDKLAVMSSWLVEHQYDVEIFTAEISVDRYAIDDLQQRITVCPSTDGGSRVTCNPALSLHDLLLQMSKCDFIITAKFHGVVFSHLLAKPVIALSYHHKIDDLMRAVGHGQYCLDISRFEQETLVETFKTLVDDSDDLRSLFRRTVLIYKSALQGQFDGLFVGEAPLGARNEICISAAG
jgi:polysaccharide pyruvyl transferase WcaK-like protein